MKYENIIIFSPPRTGSTMVYNIIKLLFKGINIIKTHEDFGDNSINKYLNDNNLIILTLRNPYNSIISSILAYNKELSQNSIRGSYYNYLLYGGNFIINNFKNMDNKNNFIFLIYEKFVDNIDYIFQILENKLKFKITQENKIKIYNEVKINTVKKKIQKFKHFDEYDKETHYHGNHISTYNGKLDYKNILSKELINFLHSIYTIESDKNFEIIDKINKDNYSFYKKTVIQVLSNYKKDNNCKYSYTGIGDLIRGSVVLNKLSKMDNFNLIIDFTYYNINNFLEKKNHLYYDYIKSMDISNIPFIFKYKELNSYIKNNTDDVILVTTNTIYKQDHTTLHNFNLDDDDKQLIQSYFKPNDYLNNLIDEKISRFTFKNNFNIIHFRINDSYNIEIGESILQDNLKIIENKNLINLENIFLKFYEKNDILLTNNLFFKNYIKDKYNCYTLDCKLQHLGLINSTTENNVLIDNLIEFFIQTKSGKIKTYSDYEWVSGFVYWNSLVYDIPLINMKQNIIKKNDKIFVIGFKNNTTRTFYHLLFKNNYKCIEKNKNIDKIIDNYDIFFIYNKCNILEIYNLYNEKYNLIFLLNTLPMNIWLKKRYKNASVYKFKNNWCWPVSDEKTLKWINLRDEYYKKIITFCQQNKIELLVLNMINKLWTNIIIKNLKLNDIKNFKSRKFVYKVPKDKVKLIENNISSCLEKQYYNKDEILFKNFNNDNYEYVKILS